MHAYLTDLLQCPACHGPLTWDVQRRQQERIETAEARCRHCATVYPVKEGIGLFLTPDLPRNDLWQEAGSNLARYLDQHPDVKARLLGDPLDALAPADQLFRAFILEEEGAYGPAREAQQQAHAGIYTQEYLDCWQQQVDTLLAALAGGRGPVVDLASGRGYLVEQIARQTERLLVATDFSPRVLRQNRKRWQAAGLHGRISQLAFDARRTPFRDGAVATLTTNVGLPNVEQPAALLQELRRIVSGHFLAISHFYPKDDEPNRAALEEAGLAPLLYRRPTLDRFAAAGWEVNVAARCRGRAEPTPAGVLLAGARPDAFPVAPTTLEWVLLNAH